MRIYRTADGWLGSKSGIVGRPKITDIESYGSFRSLGLTDSAVIVETDGGGFIKNITTVKGCYVDSITVPRKHGLYTSILLIEEELLCS